MNILFFYESLNLGGQQTYNFNLVKRLDKLGHEVHYSYLYGDALLGSMSEHTQIHNVPVQLNGKDYLYRPWKLLSIISQLKSHYRDKKIDVIVSGSGIGSWLCGFVARKIGAKHFRLMGCSMIQVEKVLYRVYRLIQIDRLIDGYFGWPAVMQELQDKGVPLRKCHETAEVVDFETFYPLPADEKAKMREKVGLGEEIVIGWIGRIAANNQVDNTVAVGKALLDRGFTDFKLLIVGGGTWFDELTALVHDSGLDDYSILTNWIPMEEVNHYANVMDVVPLLEPDPQGGSIVREAIAAGRVTVSVDGASGAQRRFMLPEYSYLVQSDAYVEQTADVVVELYEDPEKLISMGKKAREYATQEMSFDVVLQTMLKAINN